MKSGGLWGQQGPPVFTKGAAGLCWAGAGYVWGLCVGSATTGIRLKRDTWWLLWVEEAGQPRANASNLLNFRKHQADLLEGRPLSCGSSAQQRLHQLPQFLQVTCRTREAGRGLFRPESHALDDLCVVGERG